MARGPRIPNGASQGLHKHAPQFKYKEEFARFSRQIPAEEQRALIEQVNEQVRRDALGFMGIHHKTNQVSLSRLTELLFTASRRLPALFAGPLLEAMFQSAREVLNEQQFDSPTAEEFVQAAELVASKWSAPAFAAWLYVIASIDVPASPHAEQYLLEHPQEPPLEPTEAEPTEEQLRSSDPLTEPLLDPAAPDDDFELYTPMTQELIHLLLRIAAEEDSAPKAEDVPPLLHELLATNSQKLHHWFVCGFAAGLGLVEPGFALDSAVLNESRRAWQLGGYLLALSRREATTTELIQQAVASRTSDLKQVFSEPIALNVCRPLLPHLTSIDALLVEELLAKVEVRSPERALKFLRLLEEVDSESVKLLRRSQPSEAWLILDAARQRLERLMPLFAVDDFDPMLRRALLAGQDLQVRIAIGISACERLRKNFSAACSQLESVSESDLAVASGRTTARYHLQYALAKSATRELLDVPLPRTPDDAKLFLAKYEVVEEDLLQAAAVKPQVGEVLYNTRYDAIYLLTGLAIARGEWELARTRIDEVCSRFEARQERRHLVPALRLHQILVDIEQGGSNTTQSAIERLMSDLDDAVRLRTEEVDRLIKACVQHAGVLLPEVLTWLGTSEQSRHESPSVELIEELALEYPKLLPPLLQSARRVKGNVSRFEALKSVLEAALERQEIDEIESVLTEVETTLSDGTPKLTRAWAEFLRDNAAYRQLFNPYAADLESVAYFRKLDDLSSATDALVAAIERQLPVGSVEAESRVRVMIDELREFDATLAAVFKADPRCVAPTPYVPFIPQTVEEKQDFTPVQVLFVGGMREEQGRHEEDLRRKLEEKFGESLQVKFTYPGWGSNWAEKLEQAGRDIERIDALVLMPLVRTTFGRRLRRLVGEKHRPWIACSGNGMGSSVLALTEAYRVVLEQRERRG